MFGHKRQTAFTLLEMLSVMALIALATGVALYSFQIGFSHIRSNAHDLLKDIQAAYMNAQREGEIWRLSFDLSDESIQSYRIESFQLPPQQPSPEDEEAYEAWEEYQSELDQLGRDERREITRVERGSFELVREGYLEGSVRVGHFERRREPTENDWSLLFYPTGEMDQALIVLEDGRGRYQSLITNPITGRVLSLHRDVSEEDWMELSFEQ